MTITAAATIIRTPRPPGLTRERELHAGDGEQEGGDMAMRHRDRRKILHSRYLDFINI